ncbi:MAG: hypothetical protein HUJ72_12855 [Blautia sp.]|nr:hypothetical protein [Blautia sp.]
MRKTKWVKWIAGGLFAQVLAAAPINVMADGLEITEKNIIEFSGDDTAYFFARVENNGTEPVSLARGKFVGVSESGELVVTSDFVSTMPSYITLEPGQHVYAREYIWDSALQDKNVAECIFSMDTREEGDAIVPVDCEVEKDFKGSLQNYIVVTFENTTDEIMYDYYITAVMHDDAGNLIFADGDYIETWGIHPGSKVSAKVYVSNDFFDHYLEMGINVGDVEGQVFLCK